MVAERGSASWASSRARAGSSAASAAAGSSITATSITHPASHRQLIMSRQIFLSVRERAPMSLVADADRDRGHLAHRGSARLGAGLALGVESGPRGFARHGFTHSPLAGQAI